MKILILALSLLGWSLTAQALTPIDSTTWNNVLNAAKDIIVDCDCTTTLNPDGTVASVSIKAVRHIHKVGGQISCVVANPSQFFIGMMNNPQSIVAAMSAAGGSLWISEDNGVTWQRVIYSPFSIKQEAPDPWCLGK